MNNKDTPQKFLSDIVQADYTYLVNITPEMVAPATGLPYISERLMPIAETFVGVLLNRFKPSAGEMFINTRDFVANYKPGDCIPRRLKPYINYFNESEFPFVLNLINSTTFGNYITVPDGTLEMMDSLQEANICYE